MNGVEVLIYLMSLCAFISVIVTAMEDRGKLLGGNKYRQTTMPRYIRKYIAVQYQLHKERIHVTVKDTGKKELTGALNTVRDTPFADYTDKSYTDLLASITPEEARQIKELKEFLL